MNIESRFQQTPGEQETLVESQARTKELIEALAQASTVEQQKETNATLLRIEGKELRMETIENGDRKENRLNGRKIYNFLSRVYEEDEVDDQEFYEHAVTHKLYDYHAVKDAQGKIVGLLNTQMVSLPGKEGVPKEATLAIWYEAIVKESLGDKGVERELYRAMLERALARSEQEGIVLHSIVGEIEPESEAFFNETLNMKRPYLNTREGEVRELPFIQPPIDEFNDEVRGGRTHIMVRKLHGEADTLSTEEMTVVIRALYGEYVRPDFDSLYTSTEEAEGVRERTWQIFEEEVKPLLGEAVGGTLKLMNISERNAKKAAGAKIKDWETKE